MRPILHITKEREVASLTTLNQQHKYLLENVISRIQNWQEIKILSDPTVASSLLQEIKTGIEKADEWGDFTLHFEKLHPTFFQQIQKNSSSLTANDLKHCAYMKIGMTRKQVAELMKCSEEAVKQSRHRIKKKLGLGPEDFLQDFIKAL